MIIIKRVFIVKNYRGADSGALEMLSIFIVGSLNEKSEFLWKINHRIPEWFMLEGTLKTI